MAKLVYRNPHFNVGAKAFSGTTEKALSLDEEHKPYVRGSRKWKSLPDTYDTKWIRRKKSWKHRAKKEHQWVKHAMHPTEWAFIRGMRWWWDHKNRK